MLISWKNFTPRVISRPRLWPFPFGEARKGTLKTAASLRLIYTSDSPNEFAAHLRLILSISSLGFIIFLCSDLKKGKDGSGEFEEGLSFGSVLLSQHLKLLFFRGSFYRKRRLYRKTFSFWIDFRIPGASHRCCFSGGNVRMCDSDLDAVRQGATRGRESGKI